MIRRLSFFGLALSATLGIPCQSDELPYSPVSSFTLLEPWRWHELEPLANYNLHCGSEDASETLWFGIDGGIISYDGYRCREFTFPNEFADTNIYQLFASSNGKIYVYTFDGLLAFEDDEWEVVERFQQPTYVEIRDFIAVTKDGYEIVYTPNGLKRIEADRLTPLIDLDYVANCIAIDASDNVWIPSGIENELLRVPLANGTVKAEEIESYRLGDDFEWGYINVIASSHSDEVWAISWRPDIPAFRYTTATGRFLPEDLTHLSGDNAHIGGARIAEDSLLIHTKTNSLALHGSRWFSIDFPQYRMPTNNAFEIIRRSGNIVVSGHGEESFEIDISSNRWLTYRELHFQCESSNRSQWFLSIEGSIIELDTTYEKWKQHSLNTIDTPVGMIRSNDDYIWAYGSHQGKPAICYYDGSEWTLAQHPELERFVNHLSAKQTSNGDLLFGSGAVEAAPGKGGLIRYRKSNGVYEASHIAPPSVPFRPVGIAETSSNTLVFGGYGLVESDPQFVSAPQGMTPFEDEAWIDHVIEDRNRNVWVALWEDGVSRQQGNEWIRYTAPSQIRSNQAAYLLEDIAHPGAIWVATNKGISRFDGSTWFPEYLPEALRFNRESGTLKQSIDGSLWINTANRSWFFRENTGYNITKNLYDSFQSTRYRRDEEAPVIRITRFDERTTEPANVFVEWEATDKWSITSQKQLRYAYRLNKGDWTPYRSDSNTILLDIGSGDHRFEVKAIDMDGNVSQQVAAATLQILPPIWRRPWFMGSAGLAFLTIVSLIYLLVQQRIRHILELDQLKIQFFTNISHELRTPLTVILGPLESLLKKYSNTPDEETIGLAHKNARKMLALIDQILDFRSAETQAIKLNLSRSDLVQAAKESIRLIKPLADDRAQSLSFDCREDSCYAWFDAEKIEKIFTNLISNAIKYTQESGKIVVRLELKPEGNVVEACIIVEDNGSGIAKGKIDNIFEVFYRAGSSKNEKVRGSGIGLAYTKNIVEACSGAIEVESPVANVGGNWQGTRFTVSLPLQINRPEESAATKALELKAEVETSDTMGAENDERPLILLAEDDQDIRRFIVSELEFDYRLVEAKDGEIGWEATQSQLPDIVLTDVMMPNIDGNEFCRLIKSNELTAHIPVIMLTALKSEIHELEGLESGADDYIAKPVRIEILQQRIRNLLSSRAKIHDRYRRANPEADLLTQDVATNSLDQDFLARSLKIVQSSLEDPLFDVERFASNMNMSRMTLYRKFKAITGESPSAFIRAIRMKRAADLLGSGERTISEVSDLVGFSDVSHFSTAFKKRFNCSPSQFKNKVS